MLKHKKTYGLTLINLTTLATFQLGCGEMAEIEGEQETRQQEVRAGTVITSPSGYRESIVKIPGCSATIISEYAALTASHCVTNGNSVTVTFPNGRGTITGTAIQHPLYNTIHWLAYDFAVIKFNSSIFNTSGLNASGITPIPIQDTPAANNSSVELAGYGFSGASCNVSTGNLSVANSTIDSLQPDWQYEHVDNTLGNCQGDSGGPLLTGSTPKKVIGVNSWISSDGNPPIHKSYAKPVYAAYDWINQQIQQPNLPGNTWGHCIFYDNGIGYLSTQGNSPNLGTSGWDNKATKVWVKKGYKLTSYNYINYSSSLGSSSGIINYDGVEYCNEYGCLHDLSGTSKYQTISSAKCEQDAPQSTWGHCIGYTRYYTGNYISLQSDESSLAASGWDNTITHLWVKSGHTATLYPSDNYQGNPYWGGQAYNGSTGSWCNSYGCMHDLTGTVSENTANSIRCQ